MSQLLQSFNIKYAQILGDQDQNENEQSILDSLREKEECKAIDHEFLRTF